jgi:predicted dehydrogenase
MRFLVIGLGSMGKRRIRCLKSLGYKDIWAYDSSVEVGLSAFQQCKVNISYTLKVLMGWIKEYDFDAMLICVPPAKKQKYINIANKYNIPCFCEADVMTYDGEYCASRTMIYHPAIRRMDEFLQNNGLGKIYTFNYHLGQHIRDWHVGADYTNYYAAQKETGACREMFAFELSWLAWLFGNPVGARGFIDKQLNDPQITADDVYATAISFERRFSNIPNDYIRGTMLIDVVSRPAVRKLVIIGEKGALEWNWQDNFFTVNFEMGSMQEGTRMEGVKKFFFDKGVSQEGYNENIPEQMYVDEIATFIANVQASVLQGFRMDEYSFQEEANIIDMLRKVEE